MVRKRKKNNAPEKKKRARPPKDDGQEQSSARFSAAGDNTTQHPENNTKEDVEDAEIEADEDFEDPADFDADADLDEDEPTENGSVADVDDEETDFSAAGEDLDLSPVKIKPHAKRHGGSTSRSLVRFDPLTAYIQEIRRYPLLSRDEEQTYARRFQEQGDMAAARRLVTANLRLVVKIAHEYRRAHQNLLDLIQEGNIGLMQAVKKFDPYRGIKLSTYSAWWIRAYILKFILNNWRLVKIGTTQAQRKLFFNLKKQKQELERMGVKPEPKAIAEALDVSEKEVVDMEKRLAAPDVSLAAPVGDKSASAPRTIMDVLPDQAKSPEHTVGGDEFRALLAKHLAEFSRTLKGRDAVIYHERLMADQPLTLKQIGDRYGVTKERARQLEKRLLGKLKTYLQENMGEAVQVALGLEA